MKILFVSPLPPPAGGITRWTTLVTEYAKIAGDDVTVVNTSPNSRCVDGRTVFQRVLSGIRDVFYFYALLKKKVKDFQPDIVHLSTSGSLAFFRDYLFLKYLKNRKIGTTYHLHFGTIPSLKETNNFWWKIAKRNCENSCAVVTMNSSTYYALKGVVDDDRLYNLPNPVSFSELPKALDYDQHEKYILYLGWVIKEKGIEELLTAWKQVRVNFPEWRLKIVGPFHNQYMNELVTKGISENVEFCGELEHCEAMECMRKSGIFALPSYSEGFPNVIIEAMALKVPVVATSVGSIKEMLDGNGTIIEPKNSEQLADALSSLISDYDYRKATADLLYCRAVEEYDLAVVYSRYKDVWKKHRI